MRATKKRKTWQVNLHSAKVTYRGVRQTLRLCTKCLRKVRAGEKTSKPEGILAKKDVNKSLPKPSESQLVGV